MLDVFTAEEFVGRGIGLLLGMLLVVGLLIGGATYWMGPRLTHLAFVDSQRGEPFTVLDFVRVAPEQALTARYQHPLAGLFASEGGRLLADYRQVHVVEGRRSDEWQRLNVLHMVRAQDLAQIMTSEPYRLIQRGADKVESMKLGSYDTADGDWRSGLVVWAIDAEDNAPDPFTGLREQIAESPGRLVWDTTTRPFEGDARWSRVLAVDFANVDAALAWLRTKAMETERALVNARVHNLSLAVYERAAAGGY